MVAALAVGTDEWAANRRHSLGASEVATALGLIPSSDVYAKPIDVWLEKTGQPRVTPTNPGATRAGQRLEAAVRDWYAELVGTRVEQSATLYHPEHPWVSCTPDSLVLGAGGSVVRNVQIKLVGARMSFDWPGQNSIHADGTPILNDPDGIPDYYRCQVEWEMGILHALYGVEETHLVALLGGTDLRIFAVERDPKLWATLFAAARRFWFDNVVAGVPPRPDGSRAFKLYLERRFPRPEREELDPITDEVEAMARRYVKARELGKRAEDAKEKAGNEIREAIADGAGMWGAGFKVQWKQTKSGRSLDVREV